MKASIYQVAETCGVSISTVSRAFNRDAVVHPETRQKILDTAKELGYSPNVMARALKSSRSRTVGIIVPSIENTFYLDFLYHLEEQLKRIDYRLLVSFDAVATGEETAIDSMMTARPEVLLIFPTTIMLGRKLSQIKSETHIIEMFSKKFIEYDSIRCDDYYGTKAMTQHLLDNGHTNILYTGIDGDPRIMGFFDAYIERGLEPPGDESLYLSNGNWRGEKEQFLRAFMRKKPTAVLSIAMTAETAWMVLYEQGFRVPDDISFAVFDDVNWVRMLSLTAVCQPLEEIAAAVVDRIRQVVASKETKESCDYMFLPTIKVRNSVKKKENDSK